MNYCTAVAGSPNATDQFSLYRGVPKAGITHQRHRVGFAFACISYFVFKLFYQLSPCGRLYCDPAGNSLATALQPSSDSNCSFLSYAWDDNYGCYAARVAPLSTCR